MNAAESIRRHNEKLRRGIDAVAALRDRLYTLTGEQLRQELDGALAFFRHEVAPHARAEERVFYPEVSRVLGVDLCERMIGEHRYIGGLVNDVSEYRHRFVADHVIPSDLTLALTNLVDMVRAHLRLEEEVLARMVEEKLSHSEAYYLYERMERAESETLLELSASRAEAR